MAAREQPPDAYRSDALLTTRQRVDQNSLQAFYKRFSGHERTQMSDRQGADARRDATSGQFVCLCCPGAGALDQETPASARCERLKRPDVQILRGRLVVRAYRLVGTL